MVCSSISDKQRVTISKHIIIMTSHLIKSSDFSLSVVSTLDLTHVLTHAPIYAPFLSPNYKTNKPRGVLSGSIFTCKGTSRLVWTEDVELNLVVV